MKIKLTSLAAWALAAAALITTPALSQTTDPTNTPAPMAPTPQPNHRLPFHGKVVAVDTNAMTFTAGSTTFAISSTTKIVKGGKPAVLEDLAAGDLVSGFYTKDDAGKATAKLVRVAPPKKQAPAAPAPAQGQQ